MAALSITAANVVKGSNAQVVAGIAGATITAGQMVYKEASTGKLKLADADSATAEVRSPVGIALHGASDNQPLVYQADGDIAIGATATVGEIYVLGETAGGIVPKADLSVGEYVTIVGVGVSATTIRMHLKSFGVAVP